MSVLAVPQEGPWIGRALARSEDRRLLTGRGQFIDDVTFPGMLHAVVVRSAEAHALIRRVDLSAATALPGVVAVFTHADIADFPAAIPIRLAPLPGTERFLQRPLASDRVRYVGEPIALVVAENRYVAEDAAELVAVEYESLPAVVDIASSLSDTTLLFPQAGTNRACAYTAQIGDPDRAFAHADYVRQETFRCHRHGAMPLETRGLVCREQRGILECWGATKVPFWNRRTLATMLSRPLDSIQMVEVDVGGSFGVRGEFYPEDFLIPFATLKLGRPVKWIEDRRESLMATNHSREIECALEVAVSRDGTLLAMRASLATDMGAYTRTNSGVVPAKAAQFLIGPYRVRDLRVEVQLAMTTKTPIGTYRGPGRFEANFFRERLFDIVCAEMNLDRIAFREKNLLRSEELPWSIGQLVPYEPPTQYDGGDYLSLFQRALDTFRWHERSERCASPDPQGRWHGLGLGLFVESSGAGPAESARVVVEGAGRFTIYTGTSASGQGHETTLAQIAADTLQVPPSSFTVRHGSTAFVPQGFGTYHSRAIVVGGSAVQLAARKLIDQLLALAVERTGRRAETMEWRAGQVCDRDSKAALLDLDALAAAREKALDAHATFEVNARTYTYGVHLCEVAVDPETAGIEVIDYLSTEDVGRAVNPLIVHGQALGAVVQGLGGVFLDEYKYSENGQLLTGSLADYLLPVATDFPHVAALTFENAPSTLNPLGAKGAGEGGIVAVAAAVANAVAHALAPLGVNASCAVRALPLSPDNLARLLREVRQKQEGHQ